MSEHKPHGPHGSGRRGGGGHKRDDLDEPPYEDPYDEHYWVVSREELLEHSWAGLPPARAESIVRELGEYIEKAKNTAEGGRVALEQVMLLACVLVHRYFSRKLLNCARDERYMVATAALMIASKTCEEAVPRQYDVSDWIYTYLRAGSQTETPDSVPRGSTRWTQLCKWLLEMERTVLRVCEYQVSPRNLHIRQGSETEGSLIAHLELDKKNIRTANRLILMVVQSTTISVEFTADELRKAALLYVRAKTPAGIPKDWQTKCSVPRHRIVLFFRYALRLKTIRSAKEIDEDAITKDAEDLVPNSFESPSTPKLPAPQAPRPSSTPEERSMPPAPSSSSTEQQPKPPTASSLPHAGDKRPPPEEKESSTPKLPRQ